jgi:hypothetical protein
MKGALVRLDIDGWSYIRNQDDVNVLLEFYDNFHDSALRNLSYIREETQENSGISVPDIVRRVTMTFDSSWCHSIEMVFEGVVVLNLRPARTIVDSEIFGATITVKDETVFFCDDGVDMEEPTNEYTWIKAYELRWRQV